MMREHAAVTAEHDMQTLLAGIRKEGELYACMIPLCHAEQEFIRHGQWDKLRDSLGRKNSVLDEIMQLETMLRPLKEEWHVCRDEVPRAIRCAINDALEDLKRVMKTLVDAQESNEAVLQEMNQAKESQLELVRKGKNVSKAYAAYGSHSPRARFMDKTK